MFLPEAKGRKRDKYVPVLPPLGVHQRESQEGWFPCRLMSLTPAGSASGDLGWAQVFASSQGMLMLLGWSFKDHRFAPSLAFILPTITICYVFPFRTSDWGPVHSRLCEGWLSQRSMVQSSCGNQCTDAQLS